MWRTPPKGGSSVQVNVVGDGSSSLLISPLDNTCLSGNSSRTGGVMQISPENNVQTRPVKPSASGSIEAQNLAASGSNSRFASHNLFNNLPDNDSGDEIRRSNGAKVNDRPPPIVVSHSDNNLHSITQNLRRKYPDGVTFNCRNCKAPHFADDDNCPAREEFLKIRSGSSRRRRRRGAQRSQRRPNGATGPSPRPPNSTVQHQNAQSAAPQLYATNESVQPPAPAVDEANFPPLPVPRQLITSSSSHNVEQQRLPTQQSSRTSTNVQQGPATLFSARELMAISSELLTGLHGCRCKFDQLQVLFDIVTKYINDD
ncbi:hypothetical protein DMENIID0001_023150 [Sergentomyia squamirostris]